MSGETESEPVGPFHLGDWLVEPSLNRLSRGSDSVQLEPRTMDLLVFLARRPGQVLSQRTITDGVWATEFVGEGALRQTVASLREALGDDARDPSYVETISKRGYRLIAQVGDLEPESTSQAARPLLRRPVVWLAGGLLVAAVIATALIARRPAPPPEAVGLARLPPRIVVTPFEHLGPPEEEYFADGVTTELINRLSAVSELQVISRTSSMYYKGTAKKLPEIAGELGVDYVLEGSVRWDPSAEGGGRVRITAQLIHAADDSHLWSESYDRVLEDPFGVQSDVARQVIDRLEVTLLDTEREALEALPTDNMEAYNAFLRGQFHASRFRPDQVRLAIEWFERAVDLDPSFILAHAALSLTHAMAFGTWPDPFPEGLELALLSAERALELDPDHPAGHEALGQYLSQLGDFDRALEEFGKAAERRPNSELVLRGTAEVFRRQGRWQEALTAAERAASLDPLNYDSLNALADHYMWMRRYREAAETIDRAISIAPDRLFAYITKHQNSMRWHGASEESRRVLEETPARMVGIEWGWFHQEFGERNYEAALEWLDRASGPTLWNRESDSPKSLGECLCYAAMKRPEPARRACEAAREILEATAVERPEDPWVHVGLGWVYAVLGRKEDAMSECERAVALAPLSKDARLAVWVEERVAGIYAFVGEVDEALDLIDHLLSIPGELSIALLHQSPAWDPLRDHPRFEQILEKYGDVQ